MSTGPTLFHILYFHSFTPLFSSLLLSPSPLSSSFSSLTQLTYDGTCDAEAWANAALDAARAQGVDISAYQHRVFALPGVDDIYSTCKWHGLGYVGCDVCNAWVADCTTVEVYTSLSLSTFFFLIFSFPYVGVFARVGSQSGFTTRWVQLERRR